MSVNFIAISKVKPQEILDFVRNFSSATIIYEWNRLAVQGVIFEDQDEALLFKLAFSESFV